jgi:DNA-binding MurR/RpiR family transcriptional regulator
MNDRAGHEAPPQSLDQLRGLLAKAKTQGSPARLGARAQRTLAGLIDSPRQTAVYPISKLAGVVGVSASTLTRLAKRLGYGGFAELQGVFRRHIAEDRDFYSERAGRLLESDQALRKSISLMAQVAEEETTNILTMLKNIDVQALEQAAGRLATAPRVRTHGLRQFFSIACFISYGLGMVRSDVGVLGEPGHGVAHALAQLQAEDVLVVLGSAPYTRATVEACRIAAAHGLHIVAVTDSYGSPLAACANEIFITPTGGTFFSNSMAASLILAEGLLALVARQLGGKALEALRDREVLIDELGVALSLQRRS